MLIQVTWTSSCNHEDSVEACNGVGGTTTSPGPPTNGEVACDTLLTDEDDHLAPDPDDCHVFYICQPDGEGGYIPHERVCRDGTAFDDENHRCGESRWSLEYFVYCTNTSVIN